ncbi:hypothetical protein LXL04_025003 [Taraxacum kok-saghyz]
MTLFNVTTRTTLVFIVAVPNYLSTEEFIAFCGSHVEYFSDLCFIRNDAMEDRYSVLIKLVNQAAADGFCCSYKSTTESGLVLLILRFATSTSLN